MEALSKEQVQTFLKALLCLTKHLVGRTFAEPEWEQGQEEEQDAALSLASNFHHCLEQELSGDAGEDVQKAVSDLGPQLKCAEAWLAACQLQQLSQEEGQHVDQIMSELKEHSGSFSALVVALSKVEKQHDPPRWVGAAADCVQRIKGLAEKTTKEKSRASLARMNELSKATCSWKDELEKASKHTWKDVVEAARPLVEVGFAKQLDSTFRQGVSDLNGMITHPYTGPTLQTFAI